MTLYYAAFSGFYDTDIHTVIPQAAVEITPEPHRALLSANAQGAAILPDETGHPTAVFPSEAEQHAQKAESIRAERNGTVGLLNHESGCRLAAAAVSTPAARGSRKILARAFPGGTAVPAIEMRRAEQGAREDENILDSIADELIAQYRHPMERACAA